MANKKSIVILTIMLLACIALIWHFNDKCQYQKKEIAKLNASIKSKDAIIDTYKKKIDEQYIVMNDYYAQKQELILKSEKWRSEYASLLKNSNCYFDSNITNLLYKQIEYVRTNALLSSSKRIVAADRNTLSKRRLSCKNAILYVETLLTIIDNQNMKLKSIEKLR